MASLLQVFFKVHKLVKNKWSYLKLVGKHTQLCVWFGSKDTMTQINQEYCSWSSSSTGLRSVDFSCHRLQAYSEELRRRICEQGDPQLVYHNSHNHAACCAHRDTMQAESTNLLTSRWLSTGRPSIPGLPPWRYLDGGGIGLRGPPYATRSAFRSRPEVFCGVGQSHVTSLRLRRSPRDFWEAFLV